MDGPHAGRKCHANEHTPLHVGRDGSNINIQDKRNQQTLPVGRDRINIKVMCMSIHLTASCLRGVFNISNLVT